MSTLISDFVNFLEDYIRYKVENFRVNYFFNGLSNDIPHVKLAQNFITSTCLGYVKFLQVDVILYLFYEEKNFLSSHSSLKVIHVLKNYYTENATVGVI